MSPGGYHVLKYVALLRFPSGDTTTISHRLMLTMLRYFVTEYNYEHFKFGDIVRVPENLRTYIFENVKARNVWDARELIKKTVLMPENGAHSGRIARPSTTNHHSENVRIRTEETELVIFHKAVLMCGNRPYMLNMKLISCRRNQLVLSSFIAYFLSFLCEKLNQETFFKFRVP